jgi:high-affinity iron transporter
MDPTLWGSGGPPRLGWTHDPNSPAFDVSGTVPPHSWYGRLLRGTFNSTLTTTWFQAVACVAHVVPVFVLFLPPIKEPVTAPPRR